MLSGLADVRAAATRAALGRGTFLGCRATRTAELALVRRACARARACVRACQCVLARVRAWGRRGVDGASPSVRGTARCLYNVVSVYRPMADWRIRCRAAACGVTGFGIGAECCVCAPPPPRDPSAAETPDILMVNAFLGRLHTCLPSWLGRSRRGSYDCDSRDERPQRQRPRLY